MELISDLSTTALVLYVATGVVFSIYILRIIGPMFRSLAGANDDLNERAFEMLDKHYQERRGLDPRHRDLSVPDTPSQ